MQDSRAQQQFPSPKAWINLFPHTFPFPARRRTCRPADPSELSFSIVALSTSLCSLPHPLVPSALGGGHRTPLLA